MTQIETSPLAWLEAHAEARREAGLRRALRPRPAVATELDLASNDYLGLSQHPHVIDGGVDALRTWGAGATGSRLVTGNTSLHEELESSLAEFVGAAAGLVFSSGYTANLGAVVGLSGPGSLLVSDAYSHASLVDACRLSRARVVVTPHRDIDAVEAALASRDEERAVVITESVFSTDGALAPVRQLHEVCRRHRALLIVDEAHGLGVRGEGGRGLLHELGLAGAPDVVMTTTLSKALGSQGGAVLGSVAVRDHLIDAARPFIFDTGLGAGGGGRRAGGAAGVEPRSRGGPRRCCGTRARWRDLWSRGGAAVRGGVGDPRRAGGGTGRRDGLPGRRRPGGLLPAADGARRHVAAAPDRACVAGSRRPRAGPRGADRRAGRGTALTVLVVTGTGTGVGKTITTAALAAAARHAGVDVAVCKPVQTGTDAGDDDLAEVTRLTGLTKVVGLARYPQPLAPLAAAEQAGKPLPTRRNMLKLIRAVDRPGQLTLVEGAGGLLVEIAEAGMTLRDLAADLGAAALVVATAELGTLNHTALTVESLAAHGISCAGLVIGNWPLQPGVVEASNRSALVRLAPLRAALPAGAGSMNSGEFTAMSAHAFDRAWVTSLVS